MNAPPTRRTTGDGGGVAIATGIVLGILVYAGAVFLTVIGFHAMEPIVAIPPVLIVLIGAGSLLGGGVHGSARPPRLPDQSEARAAAGTGATQRGATGTGAGRPTGRGAPPVKEAEPGDRG